jgi:putative ABC transport system permease protein
LPGYDLRPLLLSGGRLLLITTARDLQFRWRRFLVAVLVTALVFGIALTFDGVNRAIGKEPSRLVDVFAADLWVVGEGASGPFTTSEVIPAATADELDATPGVEQADPVVVSRTTLDLDDQTDVNLIGYVPGGLGSPPVADGRSAEGPGEVVVGSGVGVDIGETFELGDQQMEVVGSANGLRFFFGLPSIFVPLENVQETVFGGQPLAMSVAVLGDPESVPEGMQTMTNEEAETDLKRTTESGTQTINFVSLLLWLITAGIIGSVIFLAALERVRDFAVLGAVGAPKREIVGSLVLEAVFLSVVAAMIAIPIAFIVALGLPFPAEITVIAIVRLFLVAVAVGLLASLAGVRRALTTDPALAFGGA